MTKKLLFSLCFFIPLALTAQLDADLLFLPKGDTLRGELVDFKFKNAARAIHWKQSGVARTYALDEIAGLRLRDGRYFSAKVLEGSLVEVLLEGRVNLYRDTKFYYLKKGATSLVKLYEVKEEVQLAGRTAVRTREYWKGPLITSISDCVADAPAYVRSFSFNEKSLLKILSHYHDCIGQPYREYGLQLPWSQVSYGLTAGLVYSQLRTEALTQVFNFVVDQYSDWGFQAGGFVDLARPRLIQNWSLRLELLYTQQHFYSDFEADLEFGTEFRELNLSYQTLSLPIAIQHQRSLGSVGLNFQLGMQFDFYLQKKSKFIGEQVLPDRVNTFIEEDPIDVQSTYYGYLLGVDATKEIAGNRLGLGIRYTGWPRLSNEPELEFRSSRLSLNAIIYL